MAHVIGEAMHLSAPRECVIALERVELLPVQGFCPSVASPLSRIDGRQAKRRAGAACKCCIIQLSKLCLPASDGPRT